MNTLERANLRAAPGGLAGRLACRLALTDLNSANLSAGLTAGLWYVFGAVPLQLDAAARLQLDPAAAASWFFIVWFTGGVSSIALSLRFRQPLAITWTIPGLVFLAATAGRYSLAELAGASLVAGLATVALGVGGIGARLMRWLPLPIVMGMFGGSILGYVTRVFEHLGAQPALVGAAIIGYLGGRALERAWLPPVGAAAVLGLLVAALTGQIHSQPVAWVFPRLEPVWPVFSLGNCLTLSLPLVAMAVGIGNVQGIGFLVGQGYRPPINLLTVVVGFNSVANALFGGHPSTVARTGVAIVAGNEAGPQHQRYAANLIASACVVALALSAPIASAMLAVLPLSLVASLAGLAILGAVMDALKKTVQTELPLGAFFALAIAASPLSILGIGSAFWALAGGLLVSLLTERQMLLKSWKGSGARG